MYRSLFTSTDRASLLARVSGLAVTSRPQWGRMTAAQMLAHVNDGFALGFGELPTRRRRTWLGIPPINLVVACLIPFPRNAPTPRELVARAPDEWEVEMRRLRDNIETFVPRVPRARWPDHPYFGRLPRWAWGILGYRHIDHHLRQFGV